jgi:hypothetical protein
VRAVIDNNVLIGRAKFDAILATTRTSRDRSLAEVRRLAEVIEPPPLPRPVCRDLMSFEDIPILAPAEAVGRIDAGSKG